MPIYPSPTVYIFYAGSHFRAEWYYTLEGQMPGLEYYNNMEKIDQSQLKHIVQQFCDQKYGLRLPKTMYNLEDKENKIYAFKPRDERFFNFHHEGGKVIITNAYRKHSRKMTKQDLKKLKIAIRCRNDYFARVKENVYYEPK
jgi:hypothetical protein